MRDYVDAAQYFKTCSLERSSHAFILLFLLLFITGLKIRKETIQTLIIS